MFARLAMAAVVAATASSAAFAGPATPGNGPLAPGKAAGVEQAQSESQLNKLAIIGAVGLGLVGIYLAAGTHYHVPGSGSQQSASGTH